MGAPAGFALKGIEEIRKRERVGSEIKVRERVMVETGIKRWTLQMFCL